MSRYHSYINSSLTILNSYKGDLPFSIFIKKKFASEKKFGSKDRKQIAALCYNWFRMGRALQKQLTEENLLLAFYLTSNEPTALLEALKPVWSINVQKTLEDKLESLGLSISPEEIFPFRSELNEQANNQQFYKSFLQQPYLFLRIRPQYKSSTTKKIKEAGIHHQFFNEGNTVQLPTGCPIENVLGIDKEVVIQDNNSQQVLNYLNETPLTKKKMNVWDCCAASGGKSILLYDLLDGNVNITVSDIRQSIIANLQQRFKVAGIKNYHHFVDDLSGPGIKKSADKYDIIICDAPCTGSGTWSRTPEQLYFFDPSSINQYADKQKKIAANVLAYLKNDGLFFYITCSVFKKENEEVAEYIGKQKGISLINMNNLYGYKMNADSMFVAVFKKHQ